MALPQESTENRPRIRIPPPLFFAAAVAGAWALDRLWPGPRPLLFSSPGWAASAALLVFGGGALASGGALRFWREETTILPYSVASRLVVAGPYRLTRNPMYVGLTALALGLGMLLHLLWAIPLVLLASVAIDRLVIAAEERHLEARFGDDYRAYKRRVRRWL